MLLYKNAIPMSTNFGNLLYQTLVDKIKAKVIKLWLIIFI